MRLSAIATAFDQDAEGITPEPGDGFAVAGRRVEARCNLDQQGVPGLVAERIVRVPEPVEVQYQEPDRARLAHGREAARAEAGAVQDRGQRVVLGLIAQAFELDALIEPVRA